MVFKLCAATLWGAVRNPKGAANFFSSIRNITTLTFLTQKLEAETSKRVDNFFIRPLDRN